MSLIHVVVRVQHSILGEKQAEGAQLAIHRPVAEDLAERGIVAFLDDESARESTEDSDGLIVE